MLKKSSKKTKKKTRASTAEGLASPSPGETALSAPDIALLWKQRVGAVVVVAIISWKRKIVYSPTMKTEVIKKRGISNLVLAHVIF